MHGLDLGDQAVDRADQRERRVDHVRGEVAHGAVCARPSCASDAGRVGSARKSSVCSPRNQVIVADLARRDQLAGELARRRSDIVEADHVDLRPTLRPPRSWRGCRARPAPSGFSQKTGLPRAKAASAMSRWVSCGRGDDHRLHPRVGDERAPVRGRAGEAVGGAVAFGRSRRCWRRPSRGAGAARCRTPRRPPPSRPRAPCPCSRRRQSRSRCPPLSAPPDSVCNRLQKHYPPTRRFASRNRRRRCAEMGAS